MDCPVEQLFESRFMRVFDLQYREGAHYYDATRRPRNEIAALMTDEAYDRLVPDGTSLCVILKTDGQEDRIVLNREFRYPLGRFVLSIPAGLIDPEDRKKDRKEAAFATAVRELTEETGLRFEEGDELELMNPCLFSSPGFTDESNAMVKLTLKNKDLNQLSQKGAEGSELFDGFRLLTRKEALQVMRNDMISVQTWIALAAFVYDF